MLLSCILLAKIKLKQLPDILSTQQLPSDANDERTAADTCLKYFY